MNEEEKTCIYCEQKNASSTYGNLALCPECFQKLNTLLFTIADDVIVEQEKNAQTVPYSRFELLDFLNENFQFGNTVEDYVLANPEQDIQKAEYLVSICVLKKSQIPYMDDAGKVTMQIYYSFKSNLQYAIS